MNERQPFISKLVTAAAVVLAVAAGAGLGLAVPGPMLETPFVFARGLLALVGAALFLATAAPVVRRARRRAASVDPVLLVGALVGAVHAVAVAHLALPTAPAGPAAAARVVAIVAAATLAAHAASRLAARTAAVLRVAEEEDRWKAHPIQSFAVRAVGIVVPILASLATALILDKTLPAARTTGQLVGRIAVVMAASYVVLYFAERLLRRLGPLAMLLRLSMAFPGQAPSRVVVARKSKNPRVLQEQLERAASRPDTPMAEAATTTLSLVAALTAHDRRTRGHSERVRMFTDLLAEELRLPREARDRLRWTAILHDIGKLTVSAKILNKPGPLDDKQWKIMHRHPDEGARIMAPIAPWLGEWAASVVQHHEKYDGSGYPNKLSGEDISLGARVISVADAYDTMTAARPYKAAMTPAAARAEVARCAGTHFDPVVARALLNLSIGKLWWRMGVGGWLAQLPLLGRVPQVVGPAGQAAATGIRTAAAVAGVAGVTAVPAMQAGASSPQKAPGITVQVAAQESTVTEHAREAVEDEAAPEKRRGGRQQDQPAEEQHGEETASSTPTGGSNTSTGGGGTETGGETAPTTGGSTSTGGGDTGGAPTGETGGGDGGGGSTGDSGGGSTGDSGGGSNEGGGGTQVQPPPAPAPAPAPAPTTGGGPGNNGNGNANGLEDGHGQGNDDHD